MLSNNKHYFLSFIIVVLNLQSSANVVQGFAVNWGSMSTHPLPPDISVKLLKDNGFDKVKLFEADPASLQALGKSGIQIMVGIPNEFLASLAGSSQNADNWVQQNVSYYVTKYGTDIRYVGVGNEPFLHSYKDQFIKTTFPALQNIQASLVKAGLAKQVKITVPLNADILDSPNNLPSDGKFRDDIYDLMTEVIKFLNDNNGVMTVNIYPFLSLQADPEFPKEFAFFNNTASPIQDGNMTYINVYAATFDTLVTALEKIGYGSMPIVIGEIGWPTDGDPNANASFAQRFNQGLINHINQRQGTPKRSDPSDIYIFSLFDEDVKSVLPGNFERHWGLFNYDGSLKYSLDLGSGKSLVAAKGVHYLARKWCVMSNGSSTFDPNLVGAINYACNYADCTSLSNGSSCANLDPRANASYAFNMYFQTMDQKNGSCDFSGFSVITDTDPSKDPCRYKIMIDVGKHEAPPPPPTPSPPPPKSSSPETRIRNVAVLAFTVITGLMLLLL